LEFAVQHELGQYGIPAALQMNAADPFARVVKFRLQFILS
jgi:hypothetical protein